MTMHNAPAHSFRHPFVNAPYLERREYGMAVQLLYAFNAEHVSTLQLKSLDGPHMPNPLLINPTDAISIGNASLLDTFDLVSYRFEQEPEIATHSFPVVRFAQQLSIHPLGTFRFSAKIFISNGNEGDEKNKNIFGVKSGFRKTKWFPSMAICIFIVSLSHT